MSEFLIDDLRRFQQPLKNVFGEDAASSGTDLVSITDKVLVKAILSLQLVTSFSNGRVIDMRLLKNGSTFFNKSLDVSSANNGVYSPNYIEMDFGPQGLEKANWQIDWGTAGYSGDTWVGILIYKD